MAELIKVLSDAVANQIAAGEVIQRPASLIKELVENSVDSGADQIQVILKDAGRTLVQVVDNGCGMSEMDARLCFERHATSKISSAEDLFTIRTMGFRGEALASIAAVAQVELRTKPHDLDSGTRIVIHGSEIQIQEPVGCQSGTSISVRNLFYNVPARRKFLKSNATEFRQILNEFQRIALANPNIRFQLYHNDSEVYHLTPGGLRERIVNLFGKAMNQNTILIHTDTSLVKITGYVGKPEHAKKASGEQFFFVNQRFMRHGYFHKAVMSAYERLIASDSLPSYFIYFDIDPARIDVNIHPTKTEIKFEDENSIFQILQATVRESLGKFNIAPSLDFNQEGAMEMPLLTRSAGIHMPEIRINPDYNPFETDKASYNQSKPYSPEHPPKDWQKLYPAIHQNEEPTLNLGNPESHTGIQIKNKYLLIPVKSGIMIIHQSRAYERIVYEEFLNEISLPGYVSQQSLFPLTMELNTIEMEIISTIFPGMKELGFDLEPFGGNSIIVRSIPEILSGQDPKEIVEKLIQGIRSETLDLKASLHEQLARKLAQLAARNHYRALDDRERQFIIDRLFACKEPQFTPGGKPILTILPIEEIDRRFL